GRMDDNKHGLRDFRRLWHGLETGRNACAGHVGEWSNERSKAVASTVTQKAKKAHEAPFCMLLLSFSNSRHLPRPVTYVLGSGVRRRMCNSRNWRSSTSLGACVSKHCARCVFGNAITS